MSTDPGLNGPEHLVYLKLSLLNVLAFLSVDNSVVMATAQSLIVD